MNAIAQSSAASVSGSNLDNRRMLAALIDLAVVGVGAAAILVAAGVLGGDGGSMRAPLAAVVAGWALYYYFACESGGGQTLGKKAMGLRVVTVNGRAPGMRDVAVRTVLRLVDTALVGLVSMLATGERRARLGDLAAGTTIVSTGAAPAGQRAATATPVAAAEAPTADAPAEPDTPPVPVMRPFEPLTEPEAEEAPNTPYRPVLGEGFEDEADEAEPVADKPVVELAEPAPSDPVADEPVAEPASDEPASDEPAAERPVVELAGPAGGEPAADEPVAEQPVVGLAGPAGEPAVEPVSAPVELAVVEEPAVELSVVEAPPAVEPGDPAAEAPSLDIASPSLKELARDVQAAKGVEPVAEAASEPVVEVEVAGPEVDVDGPDMSVRPVETVSAMDLIMGGDESPQDAPADEPPPATA